VMFLEEIETKMADFFDELVGDMWSHRPCREFVVYDEGVEIDYDEIGDAEVFYGRTARVDLDRDIDLLRKSGCIEDVSKSKTRVYRVTESFVRFLEARLGLSFEPLPFRTKAMIENEIRKAVAAREKAGENRIDILNEMLAKNRREKELAEVALSFQGHISSIEQQLAQLQAKIRGYGKKYDDAVETVQYVTKIIDEEKA
jgi:hypothetical protein